MNKHNRSGFSLVEMFVVIAILGILLTVVAGSCVGRGLDGHSVKDSATRQAQVYAQTLGIVPAGINCVSVDSDGDGYVSCAVSEKGDDGTTKFHAIECAAGFNLTGVINEGCRVPKFQAGGQL